MRDSGTDPARYLFVRLFLRKQAWFRVAQLGYEDELTDVPSAVTELCQVGSSATDMKTSTAASSSVVLDVDIELDDDGWERIPPELLVASAPTQFLLGSSALVAQFGRDESGDGLERFAFNEQALKERGDVDAALTMLSVDELKVSQIVCHTTIPTHPRHHS